MESAASREPISPAIKPRPPPSPPSFIAPDQASTHLLVNNIDSSSADSHEIVISVRRPFTRESPSRRRLHSSLPSLSHSLTCIVRGRFRLLAGSRLWIIMRFLATLSQIMAVLVVLAVSREERAQKPLPAWVMGYALGCIATLPLFYRWFKAPHSYINGISEEQEYMLYHVNASSIISQMMQGDDNLTLDYRGQTQEGNDRIELFMDRLRICLDFFFAIWFVLGNVWVLGTPSIAQASPKLYSLCVALLVLSCLRYAMSLVFCFAVCCCPRPWIVGSRSNGTNVEQSGEREGVTQELIDATLPIYKFKSKRPTIHHYPLCSKENELTNPQHKAMPNNKMFECLAGAHDISRTGGGGVGGFMALPTCDDEMMISVDDSACCICLRRYKDNVELRGLPCSHYFHVECVDQWLKINASCPLCKSSLQKRKLVVYPFLWR